MAHHLHDDKPLIYEGVRVNLRAVELPRRDGGIQRREIVEAADAVVILPLLDDGQVVLIRNERFAVADTLWELPAGTLEAGEDPLFAARRELTEETGYRAQCIARMTDFFPTPGFCTERLTAFKAQGLTLVGQDLDEAEKITVKVVPWDESIQMVRDGRICDAKTIATLLFHECFKED